MHAPEHKPEHAMRNGMPLFTRTARLQPESWNAEERTMLVSLGTGSDVLRSDWNTGGRYIERLSMDPAHIRDERMRQGMPFFEDHASYTVRAQVGRFVKGATRIENGEIVGPVRLSKAARHADTVGDIADGILSDTSIGYLIHGWDDPAKREHINGIEVRTAVDWEPYEGSIVGVKADLNAGIRSADDAERNTEETMSEPTPKPETPANDPAPVGVDTVAREVDLSARNAEIRNLGLRAGCNADLINNLCDKPAVTIEQARAQIQADWFERQTAEPTFANAKARTELTLDEGDTRVRGMVDRLAAGSSGNLEGAAAEYRDDSAYELAKRYVELMGVRTSGRPKTEIAALALRAYGGLTTGSLPNIFGGAANTVMLRGYNRQPASWQDFCQRADQDTLDTITALALDDVSTVRDIPEGGEYTVLKTSDAKETFALSKSGGIVPITVEMILGNKINIAMMMAERLGASMRRYQSNAVYGQITSNPVMGDGEQLFSVAHGNIATSSGAPTAGRIAEMQQILALQTVPAGDDTEFIGVPLRFLLNPVVMEFTTRQLLFGGYAPTSAANAVTDDQRALRVVSDPRLDASSASHWYGVADPSLTDTLQYGWLSGTNGPETSQYEDPAHDAFVLKARQFFFAKVMNWRAFAYNAG